MWCGVVGEEEAGSKACAAAAPYVSFRDDDDEQQQRSYLDLLRVACRPQRNGAYLEFSLLLLLLTAPGAVGQ